MKDLKIAQKIFVERYIEKKKKDKKEFYMNRKIISGIPILSWLKKWWNKI